MIKHAFMAIGMALALGGCVSIGGKSDGPAVVYYVLGEAPVPEAVAPSGAGTPASRTEAGAAAPTLLVLDTTVRGFYDTEQLVFSRSPGTRGQYQFARWTERPGKRFADLLRTRLGSDGAWRVSPGGGYVRGDLLLDTELVELYHDASRAPGEARLVLRAAVVDMKARRIVAQREFVQAAPLARYDASGAAAASGVAVGRVIDELAAWLGAFR